MKKSFITLVMLAASIALFGFYNIDARISPTPANAANQPPLINNSTDNQKASAFTLRSIQGKSVSLSDFKGKIVIVDFWATWCPLCRKSIPDLIELQKKFKNKIAVIGISVDMDTKADVAPFVKHNGINYTVLYATPKVIQAYCNINVIPTSFIMDRHVFIDSRHIGLIPKSICIKEIEKLLKNS